MQADVYDRTPPRGLTKGFYSQIPRRWPAATFRRWNTLRIGRNGQHINGGQRYACDQSGR
ncbi:hypothetical protein SAMN05421753_105226 [Planctomicrobium piriforme]|uniref:Uncharacterized protein n=1 Tax=Planctomicrobium piriforme TaxID=1576369 RepID=A0A1I3FFR7_9PLAN|nr:hypothetical protein SAMN05421753_105226 [Planctomicrobium piriforme]